MAPRRDGNDDDIASPPGVDCCVLETRSREDIRTEKLTFSPSRLASLAPRYRSVDSLTLVNLAVARCCSLRFADCVVRLPPTPRHIRRAANYATL